MAEMKKEVVPFNDLRLYNWEREEFLLVEWYNQLVTSGDHFITFSSDMRHLSTFLTTFKNQALVYAVDNLGMWFACWFEPIMSGAYFGTWVRKDKRHGTAWYGRFKAAIDAAFQRLTVLIALTKQEAVAEQLERIGAVHGMRIPALWDGEAVDVYTLTRDQWNAHGRKIKQKRSK